MVRRAVAAVALAAVLGSCGSADLARDDVAGVVEGAFASAGWEVTDVEPAPARAGDRWPVTATLGDRPIELEVASGSGRILSVDFGDATPPLDQAELEAVAAHADNPAADRARRRQVLLGVALLAAGLTGGLLLARRLRLQEETRHPVH
jgi:hypothetical protein